MKLITPGEQKQERGHAEPKRKPRFNRSRDRYLILACEHYTTRDTQEAYAAFRSSPDLFMCEICGTEQPGKPAKKLPPQPDKPPF